MNQRAPAGLENTSQNHNPHDLLEGSRAYDESIEQLRNWRERIVHALLLATSIVGFAAVIFETLIIIPERNWGVLVVIVVSYLFVLGLTLARRLSFNVRAIAFLTVFYLIGVFDLSLSGLTGDGRVFLLAFPLLALVLMGRNAGLVATVLSLAAIVVVGGLMVSGVLELSFESSSRDLVPWISGLVIFILIAAAVIIPTNHVLNRLIAAMSSALEDAQRRWLEVRQLSRGLERQVADRTKELAQRSEKLEAAVEVARGVAAIRDLRQILDVTVHLISERFAFYHAGIFLIDEERAYAVLRAASSEGGRRMLARGHRLAVGAEGIVGHVAASGRPRIVSNVGEDAAFFDNPDLPYTRSEIALPLRLRDQVIGVLDVQSTQEQAFAPDDIAILQTMADQVAMAIENAQLLEQSERALRGLQATYGEYTRGALESMETFPAFEYDRVQVTPAAIRDDPGISRALEAGRPVTLAQAEGRASLVAPLRIRQQVVGAIALEEKRQDRPWTPDEIELVEAVSEQVAQALESASFYQMEQRRRRVSDTLREITRVVGSTLDLNEVIERLLDQLATLIPFDMVSIQLLQDGQRELIGGRGFDLEAARASADLRRPLEEDPLVAAAVASRQPLVIPDVLKDPRWEQREDTLHVRSWLVAPMVMGETVIGIMTADHARPGVYDEETGGLVSAVAAQAAIAVQNARLYEESQQRALEQEGLARIAALAGSSLALDELVDGVMHEARQLLNAQSCAIMLEDEQGKALVGRYVSIRDVTIPLPEEWRVPKDAPGFEYSIFARGGDYFTNQGVDDPNVIPAYKPYMESLGVKNFCGVAIRVRERSVGEMYLLNREEGFSRHEAQVLRTIASYIGNAIENARLFQEAERREQQALALYEAGQLAGGLGGQLDMQSFFEHLSSVGNYDRWWVTTFNEDKTVMTGIAGRWEGVEDTDMHRDVVLADEPNNPVVIAVQRRETVTVSDPDNDPRLADLPEHIRRAAGKYVTEPLVMGDEVIGAISIGRPADSRDISPEDIGLARTLSTQVALTITNVRLFQQTEAALVETDALYTIGQAISRLVGLQDMLTKLAQVLVEQLGYASSWIALVDQDNRVLRGVTGAGAHVTERIIATQAPLDPAARNPSVQAAITGETMVLNDVPKDERAADLTAGARATLGRLLVTPIVTAGRTLGIISVSRPLDVPAFVQRDIDMIAAVADQAAIAVQNVRLLEETQQRVQELAMLFRASEALAGAPLRPEQIAEITARQFVEIMGVPEASVSLYDPDADMLYVLADLFVEGDELRYEDSDEYNFPLSGFPATRRVMESLQPMIIQSSDPNADAAELAYMEGLGVKTLVIIPLAVKGASIGVIELESLEEERRYPDDLLNLAMTLANQAAIALENARLFEQTQQRAERERLITEITGKIRASTNLETILQTAAQELGRALGTSRVVVRVGIEPEAVGDS